MAKSLHRNNHHLQRWLRHYSRVSPPVIRVKKGIAYLGEPKPGPKPRQLLSLPPFPSTPLPTRCLRECHNEIKADRVTAISWVKYYFGEVDYDVILHLFHKDLVQVDYSGVEDSSSSPDQRKSSMRKIRQHDVMKAGAKIYVPVSVIESKISKRYDHIPAGTLHPNADEINYLQRLVMYKDSAIIVLNKPPKLPLKGNLPVHNSMDALAAAALSYGNEEGPKMVHRLDRECSGILLMGRTKESTSYLQELFSNYHVARTSPPIPGWNDACEATCMRYWALVIGSPEEKEGFIRAPLTKVLLDDGKTERVILAHSLTASEKAVTEYRVLGPMINGCSWVELRPHTSRKHQLRVHCAEALGTPILGDYKYGWLVQKRWKQTRHVNIEPISGEPYKLRRPAGLDIQRGSVLAKVPLLHLSCRELVLPNLAKYFGVLGHQYPGDLRKLTEKPNVLRFVASMPHHMRISWNLMSSYLV